MCVGLVWFVVCFHGKKTDSGTEEKGRRKENWRRSKRAAAGKQTVSSAENRNVLVAWPPNERKTNRIEKERERERAK